MTTARCRPFAAPVLVAGADTWEADMFDRCRPFAAPVLVAAADTWEANMSDIYALIARFRRAGASIELGGGDRVRFKPGRAPLPPGLLEELVARKAEVIAALGASPVPMRRGNYLAGCAEFVGSRTILRHPGFACGRCGHRYDRHAEAAEKPAAPEVLEFLAGLMRK